MHTRTEDHGTDNPVALESSARPPRNKNCLIITVIVVALALLACVTSVILTLVVARSSQGMAPGALEESSAPDAHVSLSVLSDGCSVERGEVQGTDDVRMLTWVIAGQDGISVLERNAENETRYRYFVSGDYTVTVKAWYEGAYWPISQTVMISCP